METKLEGPFARLPDGQFVKIAAVHSDGFASVRRIEDEMAGEIAVFRVSNLEPENGDPSVDSVNT
jgi:hypothetical protein